MRRLDEADRDMRLAWLIEYVHVVTESKRRMPDLKSLLPSTREQKNRPQTRAEMAAAMYQIAGMHGLKIRTKES